LASIDVGQEVLKDILLDLQTLAGITERQDKASADLHEFLRQWVGLAEVKLAWFKDFRNSLAEKGWSTSKLCK